MGDEGTGRGAAGDRGKNRGLDFDEAKGIAIVADRFDDRGAEKRRSPRFIVDDEVKITLAAAVLQIGEAVELLGERF